MHSYTGPKGTNFCFNSDFSGDVYVYAKDESGSKVTVLVPGDDLVALVGDRIIGRLVSKLEKINVLKVWERLSR